jgi:hypothetical protein
MRDSARDFSVGGQCCRALRMPRTPAGNSGRSTRPLQAARTWSRGTRVEIREQIYARRALQKSGAPPHAIVALRL